MADDKPDTEKAELIPVNINEEFVMQNVKKIMKELGACECEVCFANACAIALNELHPKYVTSRKGALLTEITATSVGNQADIIVEATKAVMKVMKNPRH
jgi:competence protein ComFB